jgi:hypothetical protein
VLAGAAVGAGVAAGVEVGVDAEPESVELGVAEVVVPRESFR